MKESQKHDNRPDGANLTLPYGDGFYSSRKGIAHIIKDNGEFEIFNTRFPEPVDAEFKEL